MSLIKIDEAKQKADRDNARILEIHARLDQIDSESHRANRAYNVAVIKGETPNPNDAAKLVALEDEAATLRQELSALK